MATIRTTSPCPKCELPLNFSPSAGFFCTNGHKYDDLPQTQVAQAVSQANLQPPPEFNREDVFEASAQALANSLEANPKSDVMVPPRVQEILEERSTKPAIPVRRREPPRPAVSSDERLRIEPNGDTHATIKIEDHHWKALVAVCERGSWGNPLDYLQQQVNEALRNGWWF